jgi:hypothetical protein
VLLSTTNRKLIIFLTKFFCDGWFDNGRLKFIFLGDVSGAFMAQSHETMAGIFITFNWVCCVNPEQANPEQANPEHPNSRLHARSGRAHARVHRTLEIGHRSRTSVSRRAWFRCCSSFPEPDVIHGLE